MLQEKSRMIVCVCKVIKESELRRAIKGDRLEQYLRSVKFGTECGVCLVALEETIKRIRAGT